MRRKSRKQLILYFAAVLALVALDQLTKMLAAAYLKGNEALVLIPGVFELRYLENQSAAFGIDPVSLLQNIFHFTYFNENPDAFLICKMIFFAVLTVAVVILVFAVFCRIPNIRRYRGINAALMFFVAGAIGNFIDRMAHRYVIDFFYIRLIDFPIFNVADIYVTFAAAGIFILCIFFYREDDFESVFPSMKRREEP